MHCQRWKWPAYDMVRDGAQIHESATEQGLCPPVVHDGEDMSSETLKNPCVKQAGMLMNGHLFAQAEFVP